MVVLALVTLVLIVWFGLKVSPSAFPPLELPKLGSSETVRLAEGLPAPVSRFYDRLYGEDVPVVTSAVVSGRARMRIMGITFPGRFRFTHAAG